MDKILADCKKCHTRQAWHSFIELHGQQIANSASPRLVSELFKQLSQDPQSVHYDEQLWVYLLEGCRTSWNLDLGQEISEFIKVKPSAEIAIAAAKIYLDSGFPARARELVVRTLRLKGVSPSQKLQLDMLNCSTHIEEGHRPTALRLLKKIESAARRFDFNAKDRAEYLSYVARTLFLLGSYEKASAIFADTAEVFTSLSEWEAAAKALFNAAASMDNAGKSNPEDRTAYHYVERCRRIAELHDLKGPLAHCEAFYGQNAYWSGNFAEARDHYRRALQHLPASDKSYRRLHLLSMLAITYLRTGRFSLARKFCQQTLDLAALEEVDRFSIRFVSLYTEILWEEGEIEKSQEVLSESAVSLLEKGVHTLEELSTAGRFIWQLSLLEQDSSSIRFNISDNLKRNLSPWSEFLHARGQAALSQSSFDKASDLFSRCVKNAKTLRNPHLEALGQLGLVQNILAQGKSRELFDQEFEKLEIAVGASGDSPIKGSVLILRGAIAYRRGDFSGCEQHLRAAMKLSRLFYCDRFCVQTWLNTCEGRASRLTTNWQQAILARMTRIYFNPRLRKVEKGVFLVSDHYPVNLQRHSQIAEFLEFLLQQPNYSASMEDILAHVWQESLNTVGWKQKIRNTIMRVRDFFPYTMAPIILHDDQVGLFRNALSLEEPPTDTHDYRQEIQRLLRDGPQSSVQLSQRLHISSATTKRLLKQLTQEERISVFRVGRKVFYQHQSRQH